MLVQPIRELIDSVSRVPGAVRGDPIPELDGPGPFLAELIEEKQPGIGAPDPSVEQPGLAETEGEGEEGSEPIPFFEFSGEGSAESAIRGLAGGRGGEYRRAMELRGIDALGYYSSFHHRTWHWGIYLPISGVAWVAKNVFADIPDWSVRLRLAFALIAHHEYFHFAADCGIAQMELIRTAPVWWPIRQSDGMAKLRLIEEELANAHMLRRLRFTRWGPGTEGASRMATEFARSQPEGYRNGVETSSRRRHLDEGVEDHACRASKAAGHGPVGTGVDFRFLYPYARPYELARCPVHVIDDQKRYGVEGLEFRFIQAIASVSQTTEFDKQLGRLGSGVRNAWGQTLRKLRQSVAIPGLDFKPWRLGGSDCFSVRVDRSIRAHLRHLPDEKRWEAFAIGSHDKMGHD